MRLKYWYQLTDWHENINDIKFAERQLQKYGDKHGEDYIWKKLEENWAIFTIGKRIETHEAYPS